MPDDNNGKIAEEAHEDGGKKLTPEASANLASVLNDLIVNLSALRDSSEKANTAMIAYMDRLILLSGGALTLIFTVVGTMSVRFHESHQSASRTPLVVASCWLLVVAIVSGLFHNTASINLRRGSDVQYRLMQTDTQLKLKLLMISGAADINTVPALAGNSATIKKLAAIEKCARLFGAVAQVALVAAFFF